MIFIAKKMVKYDLYKIVKEELKNGSNDLVTRPSGQIVRERIEKDISNKDWTLSLQKIESQLRNFQSS